MLWHTTRLLAFVAATIVLSIAVAALVDQIASAHQTEEAEAPEHDPGREPPWPGSIAGDDSASTGRPTTDGERTGP